jgi:hypothetical protein
MTKHDKLVALERIRGEVIDKIYKDRWQEVWFFPEYKRVPGSEGISRNRSDILLYQSIQAFGPFPLPRRHFLLSKSETARLWKRAPDGLF